MEVRECLLSSRLTNPSRVKYSYRFASMCMPDKVIKEAVPCRTAKAFELFQV